MVAMKFCSIVLVQVSSCQSMFLKLKSPSRTVFSISVWLMDWLMRLNIASSSTSSTHRKAILHWGRG